jgi:hypothetical protein
LAQLARVKAADLTVVVMKKTRAEKCRARAEYCRLESVNVRHAFDEAAWLNLADDWLLLADAFEEEDGPKWKH